MTTIFKKGIFMACLAALLLPQVTLGQMSVSDVTNGKVYETILSDDSYLFDRAEYAVFIPEGVKVLRGVFIHQHGCRMESIGLSTAYDLQYQAFAKKWGLAVVGPDIYPKQGRSCNDWREPESGSADALIKVLSEVAVASGHNELQAAPWLLWGHSGGGYWTLAMMRDYPERIIGAFAYSPAFDPQWDFPEEALKIPLMIRHAGAADLNGPRVACWQTALHVFDKLRQKDGLVSFAFNPKQDHNYSYVRYMAIPFYESVLAQRLPDSPSAKLKDMDRSKACLGDTLDYRLVRPTALEGESPLAMNWLPDAYVAEKWREYSITGTVSDVTPPHEPYEVRVEKADNMTAIVTWKADADIESGIQYFNIRFKDGTVMRFPVEGDYQQFNTNGDNTIPIQLPELKYELKRVGEQERSSVFISAVNHFGLESTFATCNIQW